MRNLSGLILVLGLLAGCGGGAAMQTPIVERPLLPLVPSYFDPAAVPRLSPSAGTPDTSDPLIWYDARCLRVEGRGWTDTETFYERLPERAKAVVTTPVRTLSANSAGIAVRFASDAKKIKVSWKSTGFSMNHMAATGVRGLDLYSRRGGKWKYEGTAVPRDVATTTTIGLFSTEMPGIPTEFLLYLPLYDRCMDLKIGISRDAFLAAAPPPPPEQSRPIVFYGTSITQGGCASRPGMCHPALLGRWLNREVINLGFSGSGKMEPEMATLLAELDPCLYVLECLPNMTTEMVATRLEPFVQTLREKHPTTPILLVENPFDWASNPGNVELREVYRRLLASDVRSLYYLTGEKLLAGEEDGTVDGVHPTDLGFLTLAEAYYPLMALIPMR